MISGGWPTLQQNGLFIMYKLFAIICIMTSGELQCTTYDDSQRQVFNTLQECDKQASYRFYTMMEGFERMGVPFEKVEIGCKGGDEL